MVALDNRFRKQRANPQRSTLYHERTWVHTNNPDISGIGVRAAIYIQNLLSFIPAIWAIWDGNVSTYELESVETQSTTILLTAFAILISAMVQARTTGISNFHAAVVLSLSWMNNTNTFIYFLLYVKYKSQPGPEYIEPTLSAWMRNALGKVLPRRVETTAEHHRSMDAVQRPSTAGTQIEPVRIELEANMSTAVARIPRPTQQGHKGAGSVGLLSGKLVTSLGSLHLSMMAALGIWLWSHPASFGTANSCAFEHAFTVILGHNVPMRSPALRAWSIAIYSAFLVPGMNLILPAGLFLKLFQPRASVSAEPVPSEEIPLPELLPRPPITLRRTLSNHRHLDPSKSIGWYNYIPVGFGMVVLIAVNVIFIVDIELTLRRNRVLQDSGDTVWTFGQTLAMLLLVMPLRDILETILKRRESRRSTASLQNAVREGKHPDIIADLVLMGGDVNKKIVDCKWATALHLASSRGDTELVTTLLDHRADPNVQGGMYGTALHAAAWFGHTDIVLRLLRRGADMTIQGGEYGPVLHTAAWAGHMDIVKVLLNEGADVNIRGGRYSTPTAAALGAGHRQIAEMLISRGGKETPSQIQEISENSNPPRGFEAGVTWLSTRISVRFSSTPAGLETLISMFFGVDEKRQEALDELHLTGEYASGKFKQLQDCCRKLLKFARPESPIDVQLSAFKTLVAIITRYPGIRCLLGAQKDLKKVIATDPRFSQLWKRWNGRQCNEEWFFYRDFAAFCLSEQQLATLVESEPPSQLGRVTSRDDLRLPVETLLGWSREDDFNFLRISSIRCLAGILELPTPWEHVAGANDLFCDVVVKLLRAIVELIENQSTTGTEESEVALQLAVDELCCAVLNGVVRLQSVPPPILRGLHQVLDLVMSEGETRLPKAANLSLSIYASMPNFPGSVPVESVHVPAEMMSPYNESEAYPWVLERDDSEE